MYKHLRVNQIKVGDILTGSKFGEEVEPVEVLKKGSRWSFFTLRYVGSSREFKLDGQGLSGRGYVDIKRNGEYIGWFLVKYW